MTSKSIVQFLYEVRAELAKVVWPSFASWLESTVVVMILVAFFAIYLGSIDFGLVRFVEYIING